LPAGAKARSQARYQREHALVAAPVPRHAAGVRPCRRDAPRTGAMRPPQPADGAPPPRAGTLQRLPKPQIIDFLSINSRVRFAA
jgi:hypothetical protein